MQLGQLERSLLEDDLWSIHFRVTVPQRQLFEAEANQGRFLPISFVRHLRWHHDRAFHASHRPDSAMVSNDRFQ